MKKFISLLISLCLLISLSSGTVSAEESNISGLNENLNKLWIDNSCTQEQINNMMEKWKQSFSNYFMSIPWSEAKTIWSSQNDLTQQEELERQLDMQTKNSSDCIRITCMNTGFKYAKQYEEIGNFNYLFSDVYYWAIPNAIGGNAVLSSNGEIVDNVVSLGTADSQRIQLSQSTIDFLKNVDKIKKLLEDKKVNLILDAKIFSLYSGLSFLYLEGDEQQYLICLNNTIGAENTIIPDMEIYKLYSAIDVLQRFIEANNNLPDDPYNIARNLTANLARKITTTKTTFPAEAEALQAEGLLNGNEKGLDLLKPLTRIEAAAMLVRAIESTETVPNNNVQTFSDIPKTYWGYAAAENAASKGIVYGIGDGTFVPERTVTATEFATMMLRASGMSDFDWQEALNILINKGIITQDNVKNMDLFTRGDMAKIIFEAKSKGLI